MPLRRSRTSQIDKAPKKKRDRYARLISFWAHPERVLDADARAATSGFARMKPEVVARAVADVGRDLAEGSWDRRHGALRALSQYDVGLRLIVAQP